MVEQISKQSTKKSNRPAWVTLFGALSIIVGVSLFFTLTPAILFGLSFSDFSIFDILFVMVLGIFVPGLLFVAAYGFFKLKKWIPKLIFMIAIISLLFSLFNTVILVMALEGDLEYLISLPFEFIYPIAFFLIWWYINKSKEVFVN